MQEKILNNFIIFLLEVKSEMTLKHYRRSNARN